MIEHRCFSEDLVCVFWGVSLYRGICAHRDLCMCIALCVIPWCVCIVSGGREEEETQTEEEVNVIRYEGKMHWACKERNGYLWQRKPLCVHLFFFLF